MRQFGVAMYSNVFQPIVPREKCARLCARTGLGTMGAASLLEDITDRSIGDLAQFWDHLQSRADASSLADFESRLKACEDSYAELLSQLQRAKEILATPGIDKSLQVHWLHIEKKWEVKKGD